MKIVILNGSPKGQQSVTMSYVNYMEKKNPEHEYVYLNVAQEIKKLEKDEDSFAKVMAEVADADGIIWGSPVYVFLIPSQYKRFIELVFERGKESAFQDKYVSILMTSIHYYDHTALNYLKGICSDLKMKLVDTFSAEMHDLLRSDIRPQLEYFAADFIMAIQEKRVVSHEFLPVIQSDFQYKPGITTEAIVTSKKVVVLVDQYDPENNLGKMIQQFSASFAQKAEIVDLSQLRIKGGCLGCIQCGYDKSWGRSWGRS